MNILNFIIKFYFLKSDTAVSVCYLRLGISLVIFLNSKFASFQYKKKRYGRIGLCQLVRADVGFTLKSELLTQTATRTPPL